MYLRKCLPRTHFLLLLSKSSKGALQGCRAYGTHNASEFRCGCPRYSESNPNYIFASFIGYIKRLKYWLISAQKKMPQFSQIRTSELTQWYEKNLRGIPTDWRESNILWAKVMVLFWYTRPIMKYLLTSEEWLRIGKLHRVSTSFLFFSQNDIMCWNKLRKR